MLATVLYSPRFYEIASVVCVLSLLVSLVAHVVSDFSYTHWLLDLGPPSQGDPDFRWKAIPYVFGVVKELVVTIITKTLAAIVCFVWAHYLRASASIKVAD